MATLYENSTWEYSESAGIRNFYATFWYAQTFTPQITHDISSVKLSLARQPGELPGTITVSIRNTTAGKPSGNDLCSGTTTGNDLPELGWPSPAPEEREITLDSNPTLAAGTKYAIVMRALSGDTDKRAVSQAETSSVYANGDQCFSSTSGSSWTLYNTRELWFKEYGTAAAPSKPTNPTPANAATEVDFTGFVLSWQDGGGADTYDVYIGPSGSLVLVSEGQAGLNYTTDIDEVPDDQVIYWRVDAINATGTTTGDTWNFDARPGAVTVTIPADEATGITLDDTTAYWSAPGGVTDSYEVFFGYLSGFTSLVGTTTNLYMELVSGNHRAYGDLCYWKVKSVNNFGKTDSGEFWFTTIIFYPPISTWEPIPGGNGSGPGVGTEGTDWRWIGENSMLTVNRLVAAADDKIWYELS